MRYCVVMDKMNDWGKITVIDGIIADLTINAFFIPRKTNACGSILESVCLSIHISVPVSMCLCTKY